MTLRLQFVGRLFGRCKLLEIDVDVASLKERAVVMKWAVDIIKEAQNKKEQHYIGSSISIQRM